MMTQNADKKREQIQLFCMDDMVPQDHLLRIIDKAIDWSFIYASVVLTVFFFYQFINEGPVDCFVDDPQQMVLHL